MSALARAWYPDGLSFECTRCGHCCTGASGAVRVRDEEVGALARRFELTPDEFRGMYTRLLSGGERSLHERRNGDCIFFERTRGCTVHADRPRQCRTWPFWSAITETSATWDEAAGHCPGMNRGALVSAEDVLTLSRDDGTSRSQL